jgi:hypothetical protein
MSTRQCSDCKQTLPVSSFSLSRKRLDGLQRVCKPCNRIYYQDRVDKVKRREWYQVNQRRREQENPSIRIARRLRGRVRDALKATLKKGKARKAARTLELLGCSSESLFLYLIWLMPFTAPGATTLEECHIDHIIPCKVYDLTNERDQRACFSWRNLQPLLPHDNLTKHATLPDNAVLLLLRDIWPVAWSF